jgi:hypothetical protein
LYFPGPRGTETKPLLMFGGGFDSILEEYYPNFAEAALRRGYSVLTYEGPGQGQALRVSGVSVKIEQSVGRPPGARVIDLSERTVNPGFIDTHVHLTMDAANHALQTLQSSAAKALAGLSLAREYLSYGFTTLRDLGSVDPEWSKSFGPRLRLPLACCWPSPGSLSVLAGCVRHHSGSAGSLGAISRTRRYGRSDDPRTHQQARESRIGTGGRLQIGNAWPALSESAGSGPGKPS